MQFTKTILAVATMVLAVAASPVEMEKRTSKPPKQQCGNGLTAYCCNSFAKDIVGVIPVTLGLNCISVVSLVNLGQTCNQKVACCESGSQTGLVNVGNICPQIL